jgi:hypothetical protein
MVPLLDHLRTLSDSMAVHCKDAKHDPLHGPRSEAEEDYVISGQSLEGH